MIVRSYSGRTVAEALAKVREDLGENALIVETRSVKAPGLLGRKAGYEVVAAGEPDAVGGEPRGFAPSHQPRPERRRLAEVVSADFGSERRPRSTPPADQAAVLAAEREQMVATANIGEDTIADLMQPRPGLSLELASIRRQLARLASGAGIPTDHLGPELSAHLEDIELPPEIIAEMDEAIDKAGDRVAFDRRHEFLARYLARHLSVAGAIDWNQCRALLMVGPTGVGKTTTIAKLAGDLVLNRRRKVGLITIDTYRVGAADQLQAYADLLDIPFAVARTPAEMGQVVERLSHCDNLLIDTAGRSPGDVTRLQELRGFCRAVPGVQVMLTVAANAGRAEFARVLERFSILPIERTAVTKLDECDAPGRLYGCLRRHDLPINYITTGQEVPTDIEAADALSLCKAVLPQAVGAGS